MSNTYIEQSIYYLVGYAYGYCNMGKPSQDERFLEGYSDGLGDLYGGASSVVDVGCTHFFPQEIGTVITGIANPFPHAVFTHVYTLGDFPERAWVSVAVNFAKSDRKWELLR